MQEYEQASEETFKTVYLFKMAVRTKIKCWISRKRFSQFEQLWMQVW
jgi:hypothetical protein